ncbi:TPA: helix-turn-helix transcriptional regulator [Streptococcus suis]|uniref:XRE family transcriptional regulator n=1 Tax=Streptococcus suis TaxID=1307 RepID=A0A4T2GU09_STRSU|nr:helix-turn-helix transcriptional regulator [Streptococcus suis]MBS8085776.1 helix-turn-helix transcriptional regulator [Streptococcus suis]MBY4966175.1 helix-turn-helix transcriptional regulator [Streptococcus suis]MBY4985705.1 helix-turn-helix transcriptional regulator [Streptococcus suis]MBY5038885.1 helix-turn-helix transcriptional regulator [Streptococcus suis]NQO84395.1 helix-turn-helix transcriptional regulator [Streptococcus suis]
MTDILENISNQIREIRIRKRITQQELADLTNMSVPYISQIENNHRKISLDTFIKIVTALEVPLSDFFLPYSVSQDKEVIELLLKIQHQPHHREILKKFTEILELSQKD